ncbi:hypothetical protein IE53DRAFT_337502 [Violaceomyces palustris]|uniref:Uncharacterized protein n=1 Tax=Violaceomyces palustris TaxID=1673888 RepID=A0ACD0P8B6_9BASI|nr:hypothetical protein IE53DRAFT_337502 [Violaceomyces palustris]
MSSAKATNKPLSLTLIAAASMTNGLGVNGGLPWKLKGEMTYFRNATTFVPREEGRVVGAKNVVIMGRKTWESIPPKFKPLKDRLNVIISRCGNPDQLGIESDGACLFASLEEAISSLQAKQSQRPCLLARTFVIGGAQLYAQAMRLVPESGAQVDHLLITRIMHPSYEECDAFLPEFRSLAQICSDRNKAVAAPREKTTNAKDSADEWIRLDHKSLRAWLGANEESEISTSIPEGTIQEGEVLYEFQMWERSKIALPELA